MKQNLARIVVYLFFTALLLNFFCILNYTSNTFALTVLAACCLLSLIVAGRFQFTWYHAIFLLFILYLYLHNLYLFPEEKTFAFRRKAVLAFLAGMAAFQLFREREMRFLYLINLVLPFVIGGLAINAALGNIAYQDLFDTSFRLTLLTNHPTTLGMMLCVCLVTGLNFLFRKNSSNSPCAALMTADSSRLGVFLRKAATSRPFVLFGMLLGLMLLLPTLSKTAFFSTAIICGSFSAYMLGKRIGLLRTAGIFILLTLGATAVWQLAPIEQPQKERFYNMVLREALTPWQYGTFISRKPIWESSISAVSEHPLFGVGSNGFTGFHQSRVKADYDRLIEVYGQDLIDGDTVHVTTPHNAYLLWFAETGLIGGFFFCLLFFTPLFYCLKKRTLHGEAGLVLAAYAIDFFFDDPMNGGQAASFCVTIVFMTLGYFSGTVGRRSA